VVATRLKTTQRTRSPYEDYYRDEFACVIWRWEWRRGHAVDLVPYCVRCGEYCVAKSADDPFQPELIECSSCRWDVQPIEPFTELQARAAEAFERKARTGEWQEVADRYGERPHDF